MSYDQWKTRDPNDRAYYDETEDDEYVDHDPWREIEKEEDRYARREFWRSLWHKITGSFHLFRQPINLDDDIPF